MRVLAIHGGPGVTLPPKKLARLRRELGCPVTTYTQSQTHASLHSLIRELDKVVRRLHSSQGHVPKINTARTKKSAYTCAGSAGRSGPRFVCAENCATAAVGAPGAH